MKLVRALILVIFLYESEAWTIRAVDRRKINALKMWYLRGIVRVPGTVVRTNRSNHKHVRITTNVDNLYPDNPKTL